MHVWSVFVNGVGVLSSFPVIPVLLISLLRESSRTNLKQIKAVYLSRRLNFAATLVLLIEGLDEGRGQEIFEPRWRTRLYKVACQCHPFELEPADLTGVLLCPKRWVIFASAQRLGRAGQPRVEVDPLVEVAHLHVARLLLVVFVGEVAEALRRHPEEIDDLPVVC